MSSLTSVWAVWLPPSFNSQSLHVQPLPSDEDLPKKLIPTNPDFDGKDPGFIFASKFS